MSDLSVNMLKSASIKSLKKADSPIAKAEAKKEDTKSTAKKFTLAGLGAAAAIAAGIIAIKKGQAAKAIKEIGMDTFKEAGNNFIKGKAVTKNGKPFSGIVTTIGKDGIKQNLKYENGVLTEVERFKTVNISREASYIKSGKKTYNYTTEGKLESIDKFSWGHVSSLDPKKSGMQYIKTGSTNLDKKRAEGLENFAQKQAEIKKQNEINAHVDATRQQLSGKTEINAETIDKSFGNYEPLREKSGEYNRLVRQYEHLEQKEQQIKENVAKLKEKMHQKTEVNAQTIDKQFETNKGLEDLNDYYKGLEAREQQIKENVSKLKDKMHQKPEVNAQTIDARLGGNSDELAKLKESLLNPKPYESKIEKQLLDDIAGVVEEEVAKYGSDLIDTRAAIAEKLKSCWTLYGQEFRAVNYTVTIGGKRYNIIFDGFEYCITDKGEILRKVINKANAGNDLRKIDYENIIETLHKQAVEAYRPVNQTSVSRKQQAQATVQMVYA